VTELPDGSHPLSERAAAEHPRATRQPGEPYVLYLIEVEDARDAEDGLEEERWDEATSLCTSQPGKATRRHLMELDSLPH
jgi:hypothetical protein